MFKHFHPYDIFTPDGCEKLIVGTLPPPRFCTKEFKEEDVDFCYGSCDNLLWRVLDKIYSLNLIYNPSDSACMLKATKQRKEFLAKEKIGICDIVDHCYRDKIDASDIGMKNVVLRDMILVLKNNKSIKQILFVGGDSKNAPGYFFKKILKENDLKLEAVDSQTPKVHKFTLDDREIETVYLTSPSNAANRSIGANQHYKENKKINPLYSTFDFRVEQYERVFKHSI